MLLPFVLLLIKNFKQSRKRTVFQANKNPEITVYEAAFLPANAGGS